MGFSSQEVMGTTTIRSTTSGTKSKSSTMKGSTTQYGEPVWASKIWPPWPQLQGSMHSKDTKCTAPIPTLNSLRTQETQKFSLEWAMQLFFWKTMTTFGMATTGVLTLNYLKLMPVSRKLSKSLPSLTWRVKMIIDHLWLLLKEKNTHFMVPFSTLSKPCTLEEIMNGPPSPWTDISLISLYTKPDIILILPVLIYAVLLKITLMRKLLEHTQLFGSMNEQAW